MAHKLTLYSASTPPEGVTPTPAVLATARRGALQEVASKKTGNVSISYNTAPSVSASVSTELNDLKETTYGLQLLSLIKLYGFTKYIP